MPADSAKRGFGATNGDIRHKISPSAKHRFNSRVKIKDFRLAIRPPRRNISLSSATQVMLARY